MTTPADPSGCRWCGVDQRDHMQRWTPPSKDGPGWHKWTPPTQQQTKDRMIARRARRSP
jgi:hypothetical protein